MQPRWQHTTESPSSSNSSQKLSQPFSEFIADLIWIAFNIYFVYLSYDFVFNKMNLFWKSQTLGIPMKYFYMILPIAFTLMTIRVIQVNYLKLVKGIDIRDPESSERDHLVEQMMEDDHTSTKVPKDKDNS